MSKTLLRSVAGLFCAAAGCSPPELPPDLTFAPRADPLVLRTPRFGPDGPYPPGELDASIRKLGEQGGVVLDPATLPAQRRSDLAATLTQLFGTPAKPTLGPAAAELGLADDRLADGLRQFRRNCLQCHGLAGDGRGPTGLWIHPHPRDFRQGLFKFVSGASPASRPARADLLRALRHGLAGTAMPAFGLLGDERLERLADAVVYLSVRGQVEFEVLKGLGDADEPVTDVAAACREELARIVKQWRAAETAAAVPDVPGGDDPESVRRGWRLFSDPQAGGCLACHENYGRKPVWRFDAWGTPVKPANLTEPLYKGGGSAAELARRVRVGVAPSGMPAQPQLTDAQVADLVRFVRALPRPGYLPPDVRSAVEKTP